MFLTTLDVLYFVLAAAVGLVAIFACWFMFYLVMMVRDLRKGTKEIRDEVSKFVATTHKFCDRFENMSAYFTLLVDVARELLHYFTSKKSKREEKKK